MDVVSGTGDETRARAAGRSTASDSSGSVPVRPHRTVAAPSGAVDGR